MLGEDFIKGQEVQRIQVLLEAWLRPCIRYPQFMRVEAHRDDDVTTFFVTVAQDDLYDLIDEEWRSSSSSLRVAVEAMAVSLGLHLKFRINTLTSPATPQQERTRSSTSAQNALGADRT